MNSSWTNYDSTGFECTGILFELGQKTQKCRWAVLWKSSTFSEYEFYFSVKRFFLKKNFSVMMVELKTYGLLQGTSLCIWVFHMNCKHFLRQSVQIEIGCLFSSWFLVHFNNSIGASTNMSNWGQSYVAISFLEGDYLCFYWKQLIWNRWISVCT